MICDSFELIGFPVLSSLGYLLYMNSYILCVHLSIFSVSFVIFNGVDKVTGDYTEYTNAGGVLEKQIYTKSEWEDLEGNPFVNTGVSSENWPSRQKSQIKEEDILFLKEFFNTLKEAITI